MTREQHQSGGNVSSATGAGTSHSAAVPELIYCANGGKRFAKIAIDTGFTYGAQLPGTVYFRPEFVDQDWKKPDRTAYMKALAEHRPRMGTILDWERDEQLPEVLSWAEDVAAFVETVIIIPKVFSGIPRLPHIIGGKSVRLGYSVPTSYGGTELPVWEFNGWGVHLLGGSPHAQIRLRAYLDVKSADSNYAQKIAIRHNQFWEPGTARYAKNRWWPRLDEAGEPVDKDAPYEAFHRSCENIMKAWQRFGVG